MSEPTTSHDVKLAAVIATAFILFWIVIGVWVSTNKRLDADKKIDKIEACSDYPDPVSCLAVDD